jgi:hypothetical protein
MSSLALPEARATPQRPSRHRFPPATPHGEDASPRDDQAAPHLPPRWWQSRTRGQQLVVAASHPDYASLIAEVLDRLQAHRFEMPTVAKKLGMTANQLLKLFKKDLAASKALNRLRSGVGLATRK